MESRPRLIAENLPDKDVNKHSLYREIIEDFIKSNMVSAMIDIDKSSYTVFLGLATHIGRSHINNVKATMRKDKPYLYRTDIKNEEVINNE